VATEQSEKSSKEELLKIARERFDLAEEASSESRKLYLEDTQFLAGDQWPDEIKRARQEDKRPTLTINRIPQFVRQITNDARQNRPSIKVYPVDDKADVDTAKILQGMVKHIEANSGADVAYDTGFDSAVKGGFGYWRVTTDYCDPTSFDQEVLIKRIRNPLSVYFDPHSSEPDGSDATYAFIVDDISHDQYKALYPESELANNKDWKSIEADIPGWMSEKTCRVAEYFYIDLKDIELVQVQSDQGQVIVVDKVQLPEGFDQSRILNTRKSKMPVVRWCKLNAVEVLDETEWAGRWIPIIPTYGDEIDLNGVRILKGIVRDAKDSQRQYNYFVSSETEVIALTPRAPFIGYEGQFEGHEQAWTEANRKNIPFLEVKMTTLANGDTAPLPQRNVYEAPVRAISQARMMSAEDLKATTGIYDAALGNRSNENSGIAIQRRTMQAQTANFHFVDNLTRSIRHTGRILVDLIPKIYDTPRVARIIGEEGDQQIVKINEAFNKNGEKKLYDLGAGKYDVICDVGPSFATKRQEAVQAMLDFTKALPQHAGLISDLLVKNMDWPGSKEIADRLKKTLPPGIAEQDEENQKPIPPQVQAQMQQMSEMIEQLTQTANESAEALRTKKLELESKERIEMAKLETQATIELAKLESNESLKLLAHQIAELDQRFTQLGGNVPFDSELNQQMPDQQMPDQQFTGELSPGLPVE
jgi:hypothetical protein